MRLDHWGKALLELDHNEAFLKKEGRGGKWSINKPDNFKWTFK